VLSQYLCAVVWYFSALGCEARRQHHPADTCKLSHSAHYHTAHSLYDTSAHPGGTLRLRRLEHNPNLQPLSDAHAGNTCRLITACAALAPTWPRRSGPAGSGPAGSRPAARARPGRRPRTATRGTCARPRSASHRPARPCPPASRPAPAPASAPIRTDACGSWPGRASCAGMQRVAGNTPVTSAVAQPRVYGGQVRRSHPTASCPCCCVQHGWCTRLHSPGVVAAIACDPLTEKPAATLAA